MNPYVVMLDPSAFTVPYDDHLCRALVDGGARVSLWTRPVRRLDYFRRGASGSNALGIPYETVEHFYRISERMPLVGSWPAAKRGAKACEHVWNMASLCRRLRRERPDVIHFQWTVVPAIDVRFLKRLRQMAPCVLTVHDTNAFLAPSSRWQMAGWDSVLRAFDHLIVHTRAGQRALVARGIEDAKISIIPHGVFDYRPSDEMAPADSPTEACVFLSFGSIKPYKGLDVLLEALALLPGEIRRHTRLIIAGNPGSLEGELRSQAARLGLDDMIEWLLRFIPNDELPALFRRSNSVVFPYREIDASGALMTALPYGKAIIASRLGLFAELLESGDTAHLVEAGDPAALADAITKVVVDRTAARQMGQRAAELCQGVLSWGRIAQLTLSAYRESASAEQLPSGQRPTVL
ncbi:MAG TPA: group 1 glycosyl transferase [Planctomycetaceae bacterium]|nr:group 1 glycosyl transferase [Planctomycetaceae bacterium]